VHLRVFGAVQGDECGAVVCFELDDRLRPRYIVVTVVI